MRSSWFIAFVIFGGLVAQPNDAWGGGPDEAEFRNIKWGSSCAKNSALKKKGGDCAAGQCLYIRDGEKLSIGDVPLKSVTYTCQDDYLKGVWIGVTGENFPALVRTLNIAWGSALAGNGVDADQHHWVSETPVGSTAGEVVSRRAVEAEFMPPFSNGDRTLMITSFQAIQVLNKSKVEAIKGDL